MTNYCTVRTYNPMTGTGFISPEGGGEVLPFRQIDVYRKRDEGVYEGQRLVFEVDLGLDGEKHAINLHAAESQ